MKRKNPWITAILNFLIPGIGFIYLGTTPFVIGGAVLFIFGILETAITWSTILDPLTIALSFLFAFFWAALGYIAAEYVNKHMPSPTPAVPPEPLRAPAPSPPAPTPASTTPPKIHCVYCGAENPTDAIFCQKCGKKRVKPT